MEAKKSEFEQAILEIFNGCADLSMGLSENQEFMHLLLELLYEEAGLTSEIKEAYRQYRRAKDIVRDYLRNYWFERIRFASRAIGNVSDYSLVMVATTPTIKPTDEYEFLNIHRRGGAVIGCLA